MIAMPREVNLHLREYETFKSDFKKGTYVYSFNFLQVSGKRKRSQKTLSRIDYRTEKTALEAARKWAKTKQEEILNDYEGNEKNATLMEFYENSYLPIAQQNPKASKDRYISQLENQILSKIGHIKLKDLSVKNVYDFFVELSHTTVYDRRNKRNVAMSKSNFSNHKKALSSLLQLAEDYKYIDTNYTTVINPNDFKLAENNKRNRSKLRDSYTKAEVKLLLECIDKYEENEETRRMFKLMLLLGLRPQELVALDINKSIYLNDGSGQENLYHLHIFQALSSVKSHGIVVKETKTQEERNVYFSKKVCDIIVEQIIYEEKYKEKCLHDIKKSRRRFGWKKDKEAYFLFSFERGKPFRPSAISRRWTKFITLANEKTGIPIYEFYSLRHTYATQMLYSTSNNSDNYALTIQAIADSLGHSVNTFMKYYVHPQQEYQKRLAFVDFTK